MFWSEPTFQDNVKIEAVIASALPGGELSLGKHVIVYQVSNFIIYLHHVSGLNIFPSYKIFFVKLRQGSGKDRQGMALEAKGLKA